MRCRSTPVEIDVASAGDDELAQAHAAGLQRLGDDDEAASPSLLDVKIELARRALMDCRLCPRACGVNRLAGEVGYCGLGPEALVGAQMLHLGEVEELAPAWSVFLSGCTMRCLYCRKPDLIVPPLPGEPLRPEAFARAVREAGRDGARTIKLLGGTPEPSIHAILRGLRALDTPLPVAWESTMFIGRQCLRIMRGCVDLVVANMRYGNDRCARELSGVDAYVAPAMAALREVGRWTDVTLRHLVLPGHVDCCTAPLAGMLEEALPEVELVLLMQYVPFWRAGERPELSRRLSDEERERAIDAVRARKGCWRVGDLT